MRGLNPESFKVSPSTSTSTPFLIDKFFHADYNENIFRVAVQWRTTCPGVNEPSHSYFGFRNPQEPARDSGYCHHTAAPRYSPCSGSSFFEMPWSIRKTVSRLSTRTKAQNRDTPLGVAVSQATIPDTHLSETPKVALGTQLPPELWMDILGFLGHGDILSLATACKYFRSCTHDYLFGSVCFELKISYTDSSARRGHKRSKHEKKMANKLAFFSSANIAADVHSLAIKKETSFVDGEDLIDDIFRTLPLFKRLNHLVLELIVLNTQRWAILRSLRPFTSIHIRSCHQRGSIAGPLRASRVNVYDGILTSGHSVWNFLLHPEHVQHLTVISASPFTPSKPLPRMLSVDIESSKVPFSQWIPLVVSCPALQSLAIKYSNKSDNTSLAITTQPKEKLPRLTSYSGPDTPVLMFATESLRRAHLFPDKEPSHYASQNEVCGIFKRLSELAPHLEDLKLRIHSDLPALLESIRFECLQRLEIRVDIWQVKFVLIFVSA